MASSTRVFVLLLLIIFNFLYISAQKTIKHKPFSMSFPLTSTSLSHNSSSKALFLSSLLASNQRKQAPNTKTVSRIPSLNYKSTFKYSMALIVTLPIGTPPQNQQMVLDTGSQLSWIQCHKKIPKRPPPTTSFDPSLSSTFSVLPCTHPLCKPRIPDFTLPTTCDQNRLCHYSYFYADGTLAEGNLVREKITFSRSQSTPPLILGCATESEDAEGILGMNLGRFSFASQAKVQKFSYCVPIRQGSHAVKPSGTFYLGQNPNSHTFQYINLLTFPQSQRMPNLDPLAFTVGMVGIKIGGKKLNISGRVFRPNAGGSGQTIIDSGTEYTFLVEEAYNKVREEIVRLVGPRLKKGYVYGGALDMCFDNRPMEIGRLIGDMTLQFENGVEILINKERMLDEVEGGIHCVGIGRSESLGIASNIIGNFHQQNLWVEFDMRNRRVGFGKGECSRQM
ncbi:aspartic proteinase PCS1-like [Nicotiana tabacum]|uniref:Aspartic proteinase PCS1-like n=1 Tax=Nicotiana tabacum TaxID=4097 RepID=A0A1S4BCR3_TOBAC|nr:aspartic proteinase PCS1-like [Nicotiana tomentosiformis]XP_016486657.1 PREDICTED: aspartic proteinase PCS1-like [Nicotiana tabacum]